jgi:hypothetical protein
MYAGILLAKPSKQRMLLSFIKLKINLSFLSFAAFPQQSKYDTYL